LDRLAPEEEFSFTDLSVSLLRGSLRNQTEREDGHLWVETSADEIQLYRDILPLTVLAYNEWYGISSLPEIIAAHVLPNDPAVGRILLAASKILFEKTQDSSLSGYQDYNPSRVFSQIAAIYYAAASQNINYINPSASFETTGQKIRTPEQIVEGKLGTCIDTTLLLAACIEQAGFRPVVILLEGHAFLGVWLVDNSFDEPVTKYASILSNRILLGEFIAIETTGLTKIPTLNFNDSSEQAKNYLNDNVQFRMAIDIGVARKIGIRPMSLTVSIENEISTHDKTSDLTKTLKQADLEPPRQIKDSEKSKILQQQNQPGNKGDRLNRCKTNLLDLSLRNRLINFKDTKKSIPLLCPDIASLEDALASNEAFRVRHRPESWGKSDPRGPALFRGQKGEEPLTEYLREEMKHRRIYRDFHWKRD
jgi:hypothetical protein